MWCGNLFGLHSTSAAQPYVEGCAGVEPGYSVWMDLLFPWHLLVTVSGDAAGRASDPVQLLYQYLLCPSSSTGKKDPEVKTD